MKRAVTIWINRIAFSVVFLINVSCAIGFIAFPQNYVGAYELSGISGQVAIRAMGITFLMWNATYPLYIFKPSRYKALGVIIIVQQLIGCIGEGIILFSLAQGHELLALSITRFLLFDTAGLALELIAFILIAHLKSE